MSHPKKTVGIIWRNDGDGKGAFWDHYTLQKILNVDTVIIPWDGVNGNALQDKFLMHIKSTYKQPSRVYSKSELQAKSKKELQDILEEMGLCKTGNKEPLIERILSDSPKIRFGVERDGYRVPIVISNPEEVDIIVIAGVVRDKDEGGRRDFECHVLQTFHRRKPILLLCGGVWRLTALGFELACVSNHSHRKMVHLNTAGEVKDNVPIHYVEIQDNSTSRKIFGETLPDRFVVNSVHPEAIARLGPLETEFHIIAFSEDPVPKENGEIKLNSKSEQMLSERCIEAVCSRSGPPIVAIQWHSEAYCDFPAPNPHESFLKYPLSYLLNQDIESSLIPQVGAIEI